MATQETVKTEPKTEPKTKRNSAAAVLSDDLNERVEEYRWSNRMSKAEVVITALEKLLGEGEKSK